MELPAGNDPASLVWHTIALPLSYGSVYGALGTDLNLRRPKPRRLQRRPFDHLDTNAKLAHGSVVSSPPYRAAIVIPDGSGMMRGFYSLACGPVHPWVTAETSAGLGYGSPSSVPRPGRRGTTRVVGLFWRAGEGLSLTLFRASGIRSRVWDLPDYLPKSLGAAAAIVMTAPATYVARDMNIVPLRI